MKKLSCKTHTHTHTHTDTLLKYTLYCAFKAEFTEEDRHFIYL